MLVYLAYFIKEIKLLSTILFCLLFAQNRSVRAATLPFSHKIVKIVFFVDMELKGRSTRGIFHFHKIRLQFFINSSRFKVVFPIQIT